ncbi:gag protein [Panicum miliaceum]|uniref:Gag protein n=1 Tax=Panicum miliaceum TaxID=4540 RepID=A0A3L6TSN4_PANMI|nr:gag protein [Panicum miliaceum]
MIRQLQEEELRCELTHQQLREKRRLLERMSMPEEEVHKDLESPPRRYPREHIRSEVTRSRERERRCYSEEEESEEEYRRQRDRHRRSRRQEQPWTPLVVELYEQGEKETLQEYMHRFVKLHAKAPHVPDVTVVDAVIAGLQMGPCGEYLDRCKPRTVEELFDVMQEYSKSDRGRRRRIEACNQENKNRSNQWSQSKSWHAEQSKQQNHKPVNTVAGGQQNQEPQGSHHGRARGGRSGRGGRGGRGSWGQKIPYCYFHGRDQGHWTNECHFTKQKKKEFDDKPTEPPKSVNHTSGGDRAGSIASASQWPAHHPMFNYNPMSYVP